MVPLRLTLQNFLSYGESCPPIDLDGIHVACLCGPNGHGKSALLDAITWALWGQARTNTADDLVRLGQTAMQVELEFLLDGQLYRVTRKRHRGKNSQSDLQLQVRSDGDTWRALTAQGLRGTQERISQLLRMDYETFINSAFILQGRADEFARKTAGDRKRILGEILSLGQYDQLCDAARARYQEARARVHSLELQISQMEQERAGLPGIREMLEQLKERHQAAQLEAAELRTRRETVRAEKVRLDARRKECEELQRRLLQGENVIATYRQQQGVCRGRVEAARKLVDRAAEIRGRAQEFHALCKERDALTERLQEVRRLEGDLTQLQRRYQEERYRVESRLQLDRQRARELNARAETLPALQKEIDDLDAQVRTLDRIQEERAEVQSRLEALAGELAGARSDQARCESELERVNKVFLMLKETTTAACPVCSGSLPNEKRIELGRDYRGQMQSLKEAQGRAIQKQSDARKEEAEKRRRLGELDAKLKTGQSWRERLAQARQQHLQTAAAVQELPGLLEAVASAEGLLVREEFAPETQAQISALQARLKTLPVDDRAQARITARLAELSTAERDLHLLQSAEESLPADLQQVENLAASILQTEESMAADKAARAEAERELTRAPAVDAEAAQLDLKVAEAERIETEAGTALSRSAVEVERLEALEPQIRDLKAARDEAARDQQAFDELTRAFGRNGIQALIIENALPEIEQEANQLLSRMSSGQFNVRLVTQKGLKNGGQAETLDIKIDDGGVERAYELYSGGEAFRINFAIRIALSKLLARRAGARLETLVIDEGFGSQDHEGRQRLVEAIQAVQDDFARVLVITHIDELKEAFPTRIEVTKGLGGSQVAIY